MWNVCKYATDGCEMQVLGPVRQFAYYETAGPVYG